LAKKKTVKNADRNWKAAIRACNLYRESVWASRHSIVKFHGTRPSILDFICDFEICARFCYPDPLRRAEFFKWVWSPESIDDFGNIFRKDSEKWCNRFGQEAIKRNLAGGKQGYFYRTLSNSPGLKTQVIFPRVTIQSDPDSRAIAARYRALLAKQKVRAEAEYTEQRIAEESPFDSGAAEIDMVDAGELGEP